VKKQAINVIVTLFFLLFACSTGSAISKQELINLLATTDTPDSSRRGFEIAMRNLDLLEDILLMPSGHHIARLNAITCLFYAARTNQLSKTKFFSIIFNQLRNFDMQFRGCYIEDDRILLANMIIYFSYFQTGYKTSVKENFGNLKLLIESFQENHLFSQARVKTDAFRLIEEAESAFTMQDEQTTIRKLNTMNITRFTQQNIEDEQFRQILNNYVLNLIAHIRDQ